MASLQVVEATFVGQSWLQIAESLRNLKVDCLFRLLLGGGLGPLVVEVLLPTWVAELVVDLVAEVLLVERGVEMQPPVLLLVVPVVVREMVFLKTFLALSMPAILVLVVAVLNLLRSLYQAPLLLQQRYQASAVLEEQGWMLRQRHSVQGQVLQRQYHQKLHVTANMIVTDAAHQWMAYQRSGQSAVVQILVSFG